MANDTQMNEKDWVDDRLGALEPAPDVHVDVHQARERVRQLDAVTAVRRRHWRVAAAVGCLVFVALPWPRALAQNVWDLLMLDRVTVVQSSGRVLPDDIAAAFTVEPHPYDLEPVENVPAAERRVGFWPSLPSASVLTGTPKLFVATEVRFATRPLKVADIERGLAAAGIHDVVVPRDWEGTTLTAVGGPLVVAEYENGTLIQSMPFRMTTPQGFRFGHFMEIAFRVFGRSASDARTLGAKLEANPALVMHFPEREVVRDVPLRSGQGTLVIDPNGREDACFFWHTTDRIFIVSSQKLTDENAAALANSVQ
jgi:hypothetical protein